jgi:hypothetical protein
MNSNPQPHPSSAFPISDIPLKFMQRKNIRTLGNFNLKGLLQRGRRSVFSVNGEDFFISPETWIVGDPTVGQIVEVHGIVRSGLGLQATKLIVHTESAPS